MHNIAWHTMNEQPYGQIRFSLNRLESGEYVVLGTLNEESHGLILSRTTDRDVALRVYTDPLPVFKELNAIAPAAIQAGLATFE